MITGSEGGIRHITPAFRTFCGDDALDALPRELARLGARRAAIIWNPSVAAHSDAMERLQSALGERLVGRFDGVQAHSPVPSVLRAREFLEVHRADAVIAVGGGSSVVTARAATILLGEDRDMRELCTRRENGRLVSPKLAAPKLPQWIVPSSPTTAYAKAGAAVRDPETGQRLALFDPKARAQGLILDPAMALTAPVGLSWSAALNAFAMGIEGLQSRRVDPLADANLVHGIRLVRTSLPLMLANPGSAEARLQLMLAAVLTGQGSDHTGGGLSQALAHAIGPRSSVSNGVVEALLLPHTMRFNAPVTGERIGWIAELLGVAGRSVDALIGEVECALKTFEVPTRLRDVGISREALPESVDHAMDDWSITSAPRPPAEKDARELLDAAW